MSSERRWRRWPITSYVAIVGVILALVSITGTALAISQTVRDEFLDISYSGSDGTLDWTGPWVELGESDGPSAGIVDVVTDIRCATDTCLRIGGVAADVNGKGVWREADLATALSATLTFGYRRAVATGTGSVTLSISSDGGVTWTVLAVYDFAGSANQLDELIDITTYAGENTRIRLVASGSSVSNSLYFDDFEIAMELPAATTTATTTPATTTTTTTIPAVTTIPVVATTTTTTVNATTTTTTESTTTTTAADTTDTTTTTTTALDTTTTTTAVVVAGTTIPPTDPQDDALPQLILSPIRGLTVTFNTTVEALGENAIPAIVLGMLVSWLAILGVDRRDSRRRTP